MAKKSAPLPSLEDIGNMPASERGIAISARLQAIGTGKLKTISPVSFKRAKDVRS